MPYVITNGKDYIRKNINGKYVAIRNAAMADEFKKQAAENILNSTLPKRMRKGMYLQKVDNGKTKELPEIDIHKESQTIISEETQQWIDKVNDLKNVIKEVEKTKDKLKSDLIEIEKQIQDLAHYVEFSSLNACQGYKVAKKWHDLRCKRRIIKNDIDVLNVILNNSSFDSVIDDIYGKIELIYERKYEPRSLIELFDV